MKEFALFICILFAIAASGQISTESAIPYNLDSDSDLEINVIDADDDNDGVLDNMDPLPLDPSVSAPTILLDTAFATHDAGLRSNTASTANKNYGNDALIQTKNDLRSFIVKFDIPANLDYNSATFRLFTDSENDPLAIYYLPDSNWDEADITYNTTNFDGSQLLGITDAPSGGSYAFDLPLSILPAEGGEITLWLYDLDDPDGNNENILTKEFQGDLPEDQVGDQAPRIEFNHNQLDVPKIEVDQSAGLYEFIEDGPFEVGFRLVQMPTTDSLVYIPLEVSDESLATIDGDKVLVFDDTNWNTFQYITISPLSIGFFDVNIRPLHGDIPYYNGTNPVDLEGYNVQASKITNLDGWTVATGETFELELNTISGVGSNKFIYELEESPSGLFVTELGGVVTFHPLMYQIGTHDVTIKVTDDQGNISFLETTITVTDGGVADPVGYIVDLSAGDNVNADGSGENPFNDIADATAAAELDGGGTVLLRGGDHTITSVIFINSKGTPAVPIEIKPVEGESVKINFGIRAAFQFTEEADYITLSGVEIDGGTDEVDFWCVVAQSVWGDKSVPRGGGLAVIAAGQNITIQDCYLHDAYQKGVEILGRYITMKDNIMSHIATSSISGGHGIMRQQQGPEYFDNDDPTKYRWDINSNMLFNVEQRIYSWVPLKGFMEMVIDEGKPILIDDPKDTDGIQEEMKARITNNVVAFGAVDHIRLKSTPNLEVSNNSVFSETTLGDGITDKVGDTNTPQFVGFSFLNNAAQTTVSTTRALEIDTAIDQAADNGETPTVSGNYAVGGGIKPDPYTGLNEVATTQLFIDPQNGNFRLNPSLALPATVGVDAATLDNFDDQADKFGLEIKWDGWITDNLKLSQTILDNMPLVYDGIPNNERHLEEGCVFNASRTHLDCDVIDGAWKQEYDVPDTMQFRLNELYTEWYVEVEGEHPGYDLYKWGSSFLKQDHVFGDNWLTHFHISADTNTVIEAYDNMLKTDGDILIEFDGVVPQVGDYFDLMYADSISGVDAASLFDNILYKGFTPLDDTLEVITENNVQILRLTITGCELVTNTNDMGPGSLRAALDCVVDGGQIVLSNVLKGDTIKLTSTQLIIDKNVTITSQDPDITVQNCVPGESLVFNNDKNIYLDNFTILTDILSNRSFLDCTDMIFRSKASTDNILFQNINASTLTINNQVIID